jgi:hypothetical protein
MDRRTEAEVNRFWIDGGRIEEIGPPEMKNQLVIVSLRTICCATASAFEIALVISMTALRY